MDDTVDVLWAHVLAGWDDDKRHQAFVTYCIENSLLAQAAHRYRRIAEPDVAASGDDAALTSAETPYRVQAGRKEDARKRLQGIALLAMSNLDAAKTVPNQGLGKVLVFFAAAIFLGGALLGLLWIVRQ